ncbi:MAG: flagellar basal body P-ring formation protein FlgA [Gammaproteobacteria bacterium]|nr:flagellar basal body P-ring formation protein FlgA [Gammaproteobacteria bacterium]
MASISSEHLDPVRARNASHARRTARAAGAGWIAGIFMLFGLLTIAPAEADFQTEPLARIRGVVEAFAIAQGDSDDSREARVTALDSRLRLARCDRPLEAFWPPGARSNGATTIGVRCSGSRSWKIYVPVNVKVKRTVMVTARALAVGERLRASDLVSEQRDISQLRGRYLQSLDAYLGHEIARPVGAGAVLTTRHLRAPKVVERGQKVTVSVGNAAWRITMDGVAVDEGGIGDLIRIRNQSTRRIVHGRIVAAGRVRVEL